MFKQMRSKIDGCGLTDKLIAWALDGSFCNKTIFQAQLDRAIVLARTRKDAKLCWPAAGRSRYGKEKFTPHQVLTDESMQWQDETIFYGGKWRKINYKQLNNVLWQRGAGTKNLRLLVIRPTAYRKTKKGRLLYRQPAFLLTTDTHSPINELLQIYFDRWQLEVAHKELKSDFGLGQAQVRLPAAVARQPVLTVATYSAMHWAALKLYGPQRPDHFPLPKYQRDKVRVSSLDLIRNLRHEMVNCPQQLPFIFNISAKSLLDSATI